MEETSSGSMRLVGYIVFGIGAVVLVFMRGCVSLDRRSAHASSASYIKAQADFEDKWKDKKGDLDEQVKEMNEEISDLRVNGGQENRDRIQELRDKLADIQKEQRDLQKDQSKERADLTKGKWKRLKRQQRDKNLGVLSTEYFCQWFLIPAVLLMFGGLVVLAKWGSKAESMLSMVMIGVIVYSLFVGGEMWADSLLDSAQRFSARRF